MAYSFLSRFRIEATREDEFVALAIELQNHVDKEPGTLAFQFFRLREPGMFAVFESFVDADADKAHMETAHGKPLIEKMIGCMSDGYEREMLYDLQGTGAR